jgi:processive 1,2-diacylglycerol beta-glucosyltransferase
MYSSSHTETPHSSNSRQVRKVLILSAPVGSGHRMASRALAEALRSLPGNTAVTVTEGDVSCLFPGWVGRGLLGLYGLMLRHCPALYALSYRWGNGKGGHSLWLRHVVNCFLCHAAKSWLDKEAPDIVLSTHATPTGIVSLYKRNYKPSLQLNVVVTDFTVHRWLLCSGVDTYFVAHEELVSQVQEGIPSGEKPVVTVTGIPVRSSFAESCSEEERQSLRRGRGWKDEDFVCVLIGGGDGFLPMEELVRLLDAPGMEHLRFVAVTGRNNSLRQRLERLPQHAGKRLEVCGSVPSPAPLYQAADLVLSKGGGVTAAETLATGIPLVVYHPLPGQEEKNSSFLTAHGMARRADTTAEVAACLREEMAVSADERIRRRRLRRETQGHPDAARNIAVSVIYM